MKLLALLISYFGVCGLGAAVFSLAVRDSRGRPLVFGVGALVMGAAGLWAARAIRRGCAGAERRLYLWAGAFAIMFATLPLAFPYAFAGRTDVWPAVISGAVVLAAFVVASGWYVRTRRPPAA